MTLSPSRGGGGETGCDLSPNFHLSAPFSPPPRRGSWGGSGSGGGGGGGGGAPPRRHHRYASPLGNRPRTFSEYSAGPLSGGSPVPPLLQERSASANTGLSSSTAGAWGANGSGEEAEPRLEVRARSFTCGSRDVDPFADCRWSVGAGAGTGGPEKEAGEEEEEGGGMGMGMGMGGKAGGGGGENGGFGLPVSPFHRRRHRSRPYFGR